MSDDARVEAAAQALFNLGNLGTYREGAKAALAAADAVPGFTVVNTDDLENIITDWLTNGYDDSDAVNYQASLLVARLRAKVDL